MRMHERKQQCTHGEASSPQSLRAMADKVRLLGYTYYIGQRRTWSVLLSYMHMQHAYMRPRGWHSFMCGVA